MDETNNEEGNVDVSVNNENNKEINEDDEDNDEKQEIVFFYYHGPFVKLEPKLLAKSSDVYDKGFAASIPPKVMHIFLEFLHDDARRDLKFSHQLTKLQRKELHILCEALSLTHRSIGSGKLRYIYVQKSQLMSRGQPGLIDVIPPEILIKILSYLDYQSLLRMGAACLLLNESSLYPPFWESLLCENYPTMYNNIKENPPVEEVNWRQLFILRGQKKKEWESKKPGKLKEKPPNFIEGSSHIRTKTCKRCGLRFNPHSNNEGSCQYHSGVFSHLPTCTNEEAHKLSAKKNKKKTHFPLNDLQSSRSGHCEYQYDCCGGASFNSKGCTKGRHNSK
eukprot:TRINITY_DN2266_c0_g1_i1.p1 TRINITY_DN2266_c0_g1~~TRINITY_DN2266_c0_g1_i1.p1  ORF type:complete len:335 (+),score=47.77 TRINITY_DN2266_c0_g1_i1:129-1133(+)